MDKFFSELGLQLVQEIVAVNELLVIVVHGLSNVEPNLVVENFG